MSESHRRILAALEASLAGMTDEDLELVLGMPANTVRPRRRELMALGRVKDSGLTRELKSGHRAIVWVACDEAPQPPSRRADLLAELTGPIITQCRDIVTNYPGTDDGAVMLVRVPMTAVRALAKLGD